MESLLAGAPVELETTEFRGRILVASRDISPGELVLTSVASSFCPSIDCAPGICSICGRMVSNQLKDHAFPQVSNREEWGVGVPREGGSPCPLKKKDQKKKDKGKGKKESKENLQEGYSKDHYEEEDVFTFFDNKKPFHFFRQVCEECEEKKNGEHHEKMVSLFEALLPFLETIWFPKWEEREGKGGKEEGEEEEEDPVEWIMEDEALIAAILVCSRAVEKYYDTPASIFIASPSPSSPAPPPTSHHTSLLCHNWEGLEPHLREGYIKIASVLSNSLKKLAEMDRVDSNEGNCSPAHLAASVVDEFGEEKIQRLLDQAQNNCFGWWDSTRKYCLASGLYPAASMVNHSCLPNLARSPGPPSPVMSLYAIRPIKKGQEVSICYLGLNDDKIEERIDHLKFTYGFVCTCLRCQLERAALDGEEGEEKKKNEGAAEAGKLLFTSMFCNNCDNFLVPAETTASPSTTPPPTTTTPSSSSSLLDSIPKGGEWECRWCGGGWSKRQRGRMRKAMGQLSNFE